MKKSWRKSSMTSIQLRLLPELIKYNLRSKVSERETPHITSPTPTQGRSSG